MTEINAFENGSVDEAVTTSAGASYLISHIEWEVPNGAESAVFLSTLFGWQFKRFSEHYWLFEPQAGAAVGLLEKSGAATLRTACPVFIAVPNIDDCVTVATTLGAELIEARMTIEGYGAWAKIKEPGGNTVGLFERFNT